MLKKTTTAQTLVSNDVTSAGWQHLYLCFGFIYEQNLHLFTLNES